MPTNRSTQTVHPALERIALAAPEQRAELGVSRALLAQLAHVSPESVRKLEAGGMLGPELLFRVAVVLHTLSMYAPVTPLEDEVLGKLLEPAPFAWPELPEDRMFGRAS